MWFCGRRIRAGRSTGRAVDEIVGGGIVNRAFYIILIPAALVAIGYCVCWRDAVVVRTDGWTEEEFGGAIEFKRSIWELAQREKREQSSHSICS
jgi:hypothetical protein